jgi:hypothetical protein
MELRTNGGVQPSGDVPTTTINYQHFVKLATKSKVPLYFDNHLYILTCTLMVLNACATNHCTNALVDELFSLLHHSLLPIAQLAKVPL